MRRTRPRIVFLSYASRDRAIAHEVHRNLGIAGIPVWRDVYGLRIGAGAVAQVSSVLNRVACAIVLLTGASYAHEWVRAEFHYAQLRGVPVVVLADGQVPVPAFMRHARRFGKSAPEWRALLRHTRRLVSQ